MNTDDIRHNERTHAHDNRCGNGFVKWRTTISEFIALVGRQIELAYIDDEKIIIPCRLFGCRINTKKKNKKKRKNSGDRIESMCG